MIKKWDWWNFFQKNPHLARDMAILVIFFTKRGKLHHVFCNRFRVAELLSLYGKSEAYPPEKGGGAPPPLGGWRRIMQKNLGATNVHDRRVRSPWAVFQIFLSGTSYTVPGKIGTLFGAKKFFPPQTPHFTRNPRGKYLLSPTPIVKNHQVAHISGQAWIFSKKI